MKNEAEKTRIVIRYLVRLVQRAGTEPELLPSEMALCEKLSVSRVTVRRGIQSLLKYRMIQKFPGRKGTFTNPVYARLLPNTIGIGYMDGFWNSMDEYTGLVLGHFLKKMGCCKDLPYLYEYFHEGGDVDLEGKFRDLNMRGLLWLSPTEEMVPRLQALAEKGYPVIMVPAVHSLELSKNIIYNAIKRDHGVFGRELACCIVKNKWKCPVYYGKECDTFFNFRKELAKNNVPFPPENHLVSLEHLPELLASGKVDAIYSDGTMDMCINLMKIVNGMTGKKPVLILERLSSTPQYQRIFPQLSFYFFEGSNSMDYCRKAGTKAGELLLKMIQKNRGPFDSIVIS